MRTLEPTDVLWGGSLRKVVPPLQPQVNHADGVVGKAAGHLVPVPVPRHLVDPRRTVEGLHQGAIIDRPHMQAAVEGARGDVSAVWAERNAVDGLCVARQVVHSPAGRGK